MAGVYGQTVRRSFSISLGKHATVFQAEMCTILISVYEIPTNGRAEKYVNECSDSQEAL